MISLTNHFLAGDKGVARTPFLQIVAGLRGVEPLTKVLETFVIPFN